MAAKFVGKWKLEKSDNLDSVFDAMKLTKEDRDEAKVLEKIGEDGVEDEFNLDNDMWVRRLFCDGILLYEESTPIGAWVESDGLDKKPGKLHLAFDDGKMTESFKGANYELTKVYTLNDAQDEFTVQFKCGDASATRHLIKVK